MQGFHNRGGQILPEWSKDLVTYYWRIRVETRNKTQKRRYYRYVAKEKLRLAELGIEQNLINAVCRYLAKLNVVCGVKMTNLMHAETYQFTFDFISKNDTNSAI